MPRGHLVIRVKEASGRNKSESVVWDPNFIEGFVRAELRTTEGKKTSVQTQPKRVLANQISWDEELRLDVTDVSKELRLMLCRERKTGTRVGTSVIAACGKWDSIRGEQQCGAGIFVHDILDAAPIDKYFELFKPGAAGEGGFIRIGIDYEDHSRRNSSAANGAPSPASDRTPQEFYTQVSLDADRDEVPANRGSRRPTPRPPASADAVTVGGAKDSAPLTSYADAAKRPPSAPRSTGTSEKPGGNPVVKIAAVLAVAGAAAFFVQQKKREEGKEEESNKKILFGRKKK